MWDVPYHLVFAERPRHACLAPQAWLKAPLAQLDRASDYGSEGWGFDSSRVHHHASREGTLAESNPLGSPSPSAPVRAWGFFHLRPHHHASREGTLAESNPLGSPSPSAPVRAWGFSTPCRTVALRVRALWRSRTPSAHRRLRLLFVRGGSSISARTTRFA